MKAKRYKESYPLDLKLKNMCSENTKILLFPKDTVSDLAERILHIVAANPTVKTMIVHIGTNDIVKQLSEVLKQDFIDLLNTVSSLNAEVFTMALYHQSEAELRNSAEFGTEHRTFNCTYDYKMHLLN